MPSLFSAADTPVEHTLLRSILAARGVNLRGRQMEMISSPHGLQTTTKQVVRLGDGRSLATCLTPESQRGTVKVDDGAWTRSYDPHKRVIEITRSVPRVSSEREAHCLIRRIMANYTVKLTGRDFIAGRECDVLELDPRDPLGHVQNVWVDRVTGAALARKESDRSNNTLVFSMFTSVDFPKQIGESSVSYRFPLHARSEKMALSALLKDVGRLRRLAGFDIYLPLNMPGGFEFESCEMAQINGERVACLRYSDGVAMITVCQSRLAASARNTPLLWQRLARGETMVLAVYRQTAFMILGPREPQGLVIVAHAVDSDRERSWLTQLARDCRTPQPVLVDARNRGIGMDALAALAHIARRAGRRIDSLVTLYRDGWSWPEIADRLKVNAQQVAERIRGYQLR